MNPQLQSYLQNSVARFLTQTCQIEAETGAQDQYGSPTHAEAALTTTPCRLIAAGRWGDATMTDASKDSMRSEYRLIVGADVALSVDQRVTVDGLLYDVVKIETQLSDRAFRSAVVYRRD